MDRGASGPIVLGIAKSLTELSNYHLLTYTCIYIWASLLAQLVKNCLQCGRPGFDPWAGRIPWMTAWQPTPVSFPGESPWTEKPGGLQSMESQRVGHD